MKKLLGILVLTWVFSVNPLTLNDLNAGWFDPNVYGCVYQEHNGAKIHCVSIDYNENKDPGSYDRAERACYRELNHYEKKYGEYDYWIDGCLSSGGPYPD